MLVEVCESDSGDLSYLKPFKVQWRQKVTFRSVQCHPGVTLILSFCDPVTRLKLSMGPNRGPYSLYPRHVRASMLPKILIQSISNDITKIYLK